MNKCVTCRANTFKQTLEPISMSKTTGLSMETNCHRFLWTKTKIVKNSDKMLVVLMDFIHVILSGNHVKYITPTYIHW